MILQFSLKLSVIRCSNKRHRGSHERPPIISLLDASTKIVTSYKRCTFQFYPRVIYFTASYSQDDLFRFVRSSSPSQCRAKKARTRSSFTRARLENELAAGQLEGTRHPSSRGASSSNACFAGRDTPHGTGKQSHAGKRRRHEVSRF